MRGMLRVVRALRSEVVSEGMRSEEEVYQVCLHYATSVPVLEVRVLVCVWGCASIWACDARTNAQSLKWKRRVPPPAH